MEASAMSRFRQTRFWNVLVVLWLAYCSYTMVRRPFSVARAEIEKELQTSAAALSWVDTSFVVTYSFAQLCYGTLKQHLSYASILLLGLSVSALSCVVLAMSSNVMVFVVAWGVNGIAQGTGWASCVAILNSWVFAEERGSVMGVWSTNMAAGGVLGNVIPAYLMGKGFSWREATMIEVFAGPCVVLLLTLLLLKKHPNQIGLPSVQQLANGLTVEQLQETPKVGLTADGEYILVKSTSPLPQKPGEDAQGGAATAQCADSKADAAVKGEAPASALAILRLPGALGYSLSYFLHKLVRYAFMFWLPYYLNKELSATSEMAGYVASAFDIGGVVGIVVSGYASDCLYGGRRRMLVLLLFTAGMAVSTFCLGALTQYFAEAMSLCTALVFLVGLFSFAVDALQSGPCLMGFCDTLGAPVGAVSGVVGGVGSLGSALQGVFTVVLSSTSWGLLFVSFSAATVVAALLVMPVLLMEVSANSRKR